MFFFRHVKLIFNLLISLSILCVQHENTYGYEYAIEYIDNLLQGYGYSTTLHGINDKGQVVGIADPSPLGKNHGFLYSYGYMNDLGELDSSYPYSAANAINNHGQIVGSSVTSSGLGHSVFWNNNPIVDIHSANLNSPSSFATGINKKGQIIGTFSYSENNNEYDHAYLYPDPNSGTMQMKDLGTLDGYNISRARAINDKGQVIVNCIAFGTHAFLYSNNSKPDIGTLGGAYTRAWDINDKSQIVGSSDTSDNVTHGFIYENGNMVDLDRVLNLSVDYGSEIKSINYYGQFTGTYADNSGAHYFLYTNGDITPTDIGNNQGINLNNRGQILGSDALYLYSGGNTKNISTFNKPFYNVFFYGIGELWHIR